MSSNTGHSYRRAEYVRRPEGEDAQYPREWGEEANKPPPVEPKKSG